MKLLLKNANVYKNGKSDILISDSVIDKISPAIDDNLADAVYNLENKYIFPGFADVHVHLREPGFSYKETILTGTRAAAHGGYCAVCSMPNLIPVPDCAENLKRQLEVIDRDAVISVYPYGAITKGQNGEELSDMEELSDGVIAFSDDGRGVQSEQMMKEAMLKAKMLGKIIAAHCEDNSLLNGGCIHDGKYARLNGYRGICSESEWGPIKRDLELVRKTGCSYHVCHVSAKKSVELIRKAKAEGLDVTSETAPHYLVFDDMDLRDSGSFKMNPPIRSKEDREALKEGIKDGTIDMIATDHAPHSAEEKSKGLKDSLNGIVGIETAFSVLYTELVKKKIISLDRLVELLSVNPSNRFGLNIRLKEGERANLTVFDLDEKYVINSEEFLSLGRSTPFEGREVYGKCLLTMCGGKASYISAED